MSTLAQGTCKPCREDVPPLTAEELQKLHAQLDGWDVVEAHHLSKTYTFPNFVTALGFVDRVGGLAEQQGHHPDIHLAWGKVAIDTWTHKINGLTESDFVLAAKIDTLPGA